MLVVGNYVSPYVRKVLAALALKSIAYQIDPLTPFYGDDAFTRLSPLRRIPVLIDGDLTLTDSAVICEYLDDAYPKHPLLPRGVADRARARVLHGWADDRLGELLIWRLFWPIAVKPNVFGAPRDKEAARQVVEHDLPPALDYLEREAPEAGFLSGDIGSADIAVAAPFRNAAWVRTPIDAERWPRAAAYVARVLDHPALADLRAFEELSLRTPPPEQRAALIAAGAPISATTYGLAEPRPSPTRG